MLESEVIIKFSKGDRNAFKYIYEHYFDIVFYYILSMTHNRVEAEDLAEDVFIKLWEKRAKISVKKSFRNYILSTSHNIVIDFFSSKRNLIDRASQPSNLNYINEAEEVLFKEFSDTFLLTQDLRKEIHKAINNLPNKCRKIFKMSRLYDMKNTEIANKLNISINTVEKQISIALRRLREALNEYIPLFFLLLSLLPK